MRATILASVIQDTADTGAASRLRRPHALLLAWTIGFGAWLWAPMFRAGAINRDTDYLRFVVDRATAWRSVVEYGQFPMRTHQLGGGVPSLAHPHDIALHPLSLLTYAFGPLLGSKLEYVLLWLLGVLGVYALTARALRMRWPAVALATTTMAALSWTPHRTLGGDVPELQYLLAPGLLALFLLARRSRGALVAASLVLASCALIGAYRVVLIAALPLIFLPLQTLLEAPRASRGRALRRDLEVLAVGIGAAVLMALPRIVVSLPYVRSSFRWTTRWTQDFQTPLQMAQIVFMPPTAHGYLHTWSHHVGPLIAVLAVVGLLAGRRALPPLVIGLVALWMSGGNHWPINGFALLQKLPVLGAITAAPKQFNFFLVLSLLLLAALGVDLLWGLARRRGRARAFAAVAIVVVGVHAVLLGTIGRTLLVRSFAATVERLPPEGAMAAIVEGRIALPAAGSRPFHTADFQSPREESPLYVSKSSPLEQPHLLYWVLSGYGEPTWWDSFFPEGAVQPSHRLYEGTGDMAANPDYRGELFLESGAECFAIEAFTPHRIRVRTSCATPEVLVINQNADPHWRSAVGPTEARDGLLAVPVAPGESIDLRYRMPELRLGLAGALLGLWLLMRWARWRRDGWADSALSGAGPAAPASG